MDAAIPWRRTAIVAAAVATVELVALLAVGAVAIARPLARSAHSASAKAGTSGAAHPLAHRLATVAPEAPRLSRAETHVLVLNGNGRQGAASAEAQTLETRGYAIGRTGNATRSDYPQSLVMYRPGYRPEALRLARDAGIRVVGPLDGLRVRDLGRAQLALVVGR